MRISDLKSFENIQSDNTIYKQNYNSDLTFEFKKKSEYLSKYEKRDNLHKRETNQVLKSKQGNKKLLKELSLFYVDSDKNTNFVRKENRFKSNASSSKQRHKISESYNNSLKSKGKVYKQSCKTFDKNTLKEILLKRSNKVYIFNISSKNYRIKLQEKWQHYSSPTQVLQRNFQKIKQDLVL